MRGIFCGTTAKNNEEYKKVVKARMGGMAVTLIGGIFYPVLIQVLLLVMAVFLVTYFISYKLYENKM